jgi:hypothetical protein
MLGISLIVLIGGTCIVSALWHLKRHLRRSRVRWSQVTASILIVIGSLGFFGSAASAVGGLNWLPSSFEWPMGRVDGVVAMDDGRYVVPHEPSGRVQVYSSSWKFLTGWHVSAGGGMFKVLPSEDNQIEVITVRGQQRYVYDLTGNQISKQSYEPLDYGSFGHPGIPMNVPTRPWLLFLSQPALAWAFFAIGALILLVTRESEPRAKAA